MLDSNFCKWVSERMWHKGMSCFADGSEDEIKKVEFQMSIRKETLVRKLKYKNNPVSLLYVSPNEFPLVPTQKFYDYIEEIDGATMRLCDTISLMKCGNVVGHYEVV